MARRDQKQIRDYVEQITKPIGGLEALPAQVDEQVEEQRAGEEAAGPALPVDTGRKAKPGAQVAGRSLADAARSAAKKLRTPTATLDAAELAATEAIIIPDKRPAFEIVDGDFSVTHRLWKHLADGEVHRRLTDAIPAIGRIRYSTIPKNGFRELKVNFYREISTGFELIQELRSCGHRQDAVCIKLPDGRSRET